MQALQEENWALRRRNKELSAINHELIGLVGEGGGGGVGELSKLVHGTVDRFSKVIW